MATGGAAGVAIIAAVGTGAGIGGFSGGIANVTTGGSFINGFVGGAINFRVSGTNVSGSKLGNKCLEGAGKLANRVWNGFMNLIGFSANEITYISAYEGYDGIQNLLTEDEK